MENLKRFFTSKPTVLALFTLISTLLAIPLVILVAQEKQTIRQYAAEKQKEEVEGAMTGTLSGYVYIDSNMNGQRDAEEKPFSGSTIRVSAKVNNAITVRDMKTDSFGFFMHRFENQTLGAQIRIILPDGYKSTTPNPVNAVNSQKQILEFGVTGGPSVSPQPSCTPRPACLDSVPRCLVAEPITGWCPAPSKPYRLPPTSVPYKTMEYKKPATTNVAPTGKL